MIEVRGPDGGRSIGYVMVRYISYILEILVAAICSSPGRLSLNEKKVLLFSWFRNLAARLQLILRTCLICLRSVVSHEEL